ncbi:MAG: Na+/H+ antiporter NhaC family protein [Clostridia bacterium]|nr:Na+/H+ antiporter NhaC family protein [Clostridia bacterium]
MSLFVGIAAGALFYANFHPVRALTGMFEKGFIAKLADPWNVGIIIFLVLLGILVALMNRAGGSAAYGAWAAKKIKSRRGAQLATVALGVLIFVDDYFNCLTVGSVMRPVTDSHHISRAKLSYIIDATAAPVCIIAPISSWAAAVAGVVDNTDGMGWFLRAIPYNYYALLTIVMIVTITLLDFDYGPMKKHEDNAIYHNDLYTTPGRPYANMEAEVVSGKGKIIDLVLPVIVLIVCCVTGMIYTGGFFEGTGFVQSFANCDASLGLALGSCVTLLFAFFFFLLRRVLSFKEFAECIPKGFVAMVPAILILTFAWTLSGMTGLLGGAEYVAGVVDNMAGALRSFLPAIIFLIGCGLSFATGTSWGTFGILLPIVVKVIDPTSELMVIAISACLAGAVCGDHCSPISDTTIMASTGAQSDHINHVSTQLPYAMTIAALSFLFYVITGFVQHWYIMLPVAILVTVGLLVILRAAIKNRQPAASAKK